MKKILALVAILAIGLGSVNAQESLRWGVTAGMNSSKYSNDFLNSRTGFHVGVRQKWHCRKLLKVFTLNLADY